MIEKVILSPDPDLPPAIITYADEKGDFVLDIPHGITRDILFELVEEVKRITDWQDVLEE